MKSRDYYQPNDERNLQFKSATAAEIVTALGNIWELLEKRRQCQIQDTTIEAFTWVNTNLQQPDGAIVRNSRIKERKDRIQNFTDLSKTPIGRFGNLIKALPEPLPLKATKTRDGVFFVENTDIQLIDDATRAAVETRRRVKEVLCDLGETQTDILLRALANEYAPTSLETNPDILDQAREAIASFAKITERNGLYLLHSLNEGPTLFNRNPLQGISRSATPTAHQSPRPSPVSIANIRQPKSLSDCSVELASIDFNSLACRIIDTLSDTKFTLDKKRRDYLHALLEITSTQNRCAVLSKDAARRLLTALETMTVENECKKTVLQDLVKRLQEGIADPEGGENLSFTKRARLLDPPAITDEGAALSATVRRNRSLPAPRLNFL